MESLSHKKVLFIYAGGTTFGPDFNINLLKKWLDGFFELQMMAEVEPYFLWHGPGSDVNWDLAKDVVEVINKYYKKYSGFVISHSLDNIGYTSSLVAFMTQNTGKPIVFAGSSLSEEDTKTTNIKTENKLAFGELETLNLRSGLINAAQIATMDTSEVGLAIGNHFIKAAQNQFDWSDPMHSLISMKNRSLAKIHFGMQLLSNVKKRTDIDIKFEAKFNKNIKILDCYPQAQLPDDIKDYDGIFIKGYHEQVIPTNWHLPKVPICIYSQYLKAGKLPYILCKDMTVETAIAKFMWALGQTRDTKKIKKIMSKNLIGELK